MATSQVIKQADLNLSVQQDDQKSAGSRIKRDIKKQKTLMTLLNVNEPKKSAFKNLNRRGIELNERQDRNLVRVSEVKKFSPSRT
jgi:hypothetical protein